MPKEWKFALNRLRNTRSPYLHQHQDNPVHWQPWDDEALAQAKQQDKPILLSVGYAACHWCHVMAHESFEDDETARIMNEHFVNIKVDREERPDIDKIYQASHYLFARRGGGWPLTMFLTPEGYPFFGGTYFPKYPSHGLTSFTDLLQKVHLAWTHDRQAIIEKNKAVLTFLNHLDAYPQPSVLTNAVLDSAIEQFERLFDDDGAGLGRSPKFPHPVELGFCLKQARLKNNKALLQKVIVSIDTMCERGLYDHLSGGFYRYCVDKEWAVPHFEKMLYDNALLLLLLTEANLPQHTAVIEKTIRWLVDFMRDETGCFYASMDADTADGEGAYYLWDAAVIKTLVNDEEYRIVSHLWGLHDAPDVDEKWHLQNKKSLIQTAQQLDCSVAYCNTQLQSAQQKLLTARQKRKAPDIDNKILCAWNALLIKALIRASRYYKNDEWLSIAKTSLRALFTQMRILNRTIAVSHQQQLGDNGFVDDCAFLLDATVEMLHADFSAEWLFYANTLALELHENYEDCFNGGFFFTDEAQSTLIRRIKSFEDSAIPSGNGVACVALQKLYWLTANPLYATMVEAALNVFSQMIEQQSTAAASLLESLHYHLQPPALVFLCGEVALCKQWQWQLETDTQTDCLVYVLADNQEELPSSMQKPTPKSGVHAVVCTKQHCLPAIDDFATLHATVTQGHRHNGV